MTGKKKRLAKGCFAIVMVICGMLLAYEPSNTYQKNAGTDYGSGQQLHAVTTSAQPADDRKEEKTSTTSQLYARAAVLMDAVSGRVLLGKNEDLKLPMASTTKIMTCILVLEKGNMEDIIPVSSYAAGQPKVHMGAKKGEYYKVSDLLYSLMLESHNDSAVILAEYYGSQWEGLSLDCASHSSAESQKAVTAFAAKMNERAKKLGCEDTFFVTPNGLDGVLKTEENNVMEEKEHLTTAADLAAIMKYCAWDSPASKEFLKITETSSWSFNNYVKTDGGNSYSKGNRVITCNNHNAFLQMMDGVLTGKTGFTSKAGYCYVGALEKEDKKFTIALLACGWPNNKTWKWHDSRLLFEYGLDSFYWRDLYTEEKTEKVPVEDGQETDVGTTLCKEEIMMLMDGSEEIEVTIKLPDKLSAPVIKGQIVGEQCYYVNGELVKSLPVKAVKDVSRIDYKFCLKKLVKLALL